MIVFVSEMIFSSSNLFVCFCYMPPQGSCNRASENRLVNFQVRVVLKPLVSLISHLVACSARVSVDTHTHTQTDRQTDRQTDKPTVTLAAHARRGLIMDERYNYYALALPFLIQWRDLSLPTLNLVVCHQGACHRHAWPLRGLMLPASLPHHTLCVLLLNLLPQLLFKITLTLPNGSTSLLYF